MRRRKHWWHWFRGPRGERGLPGATGPIGATGGTGQFMNLANEIMALNYRVQALEKLWFDKKP